MTILDIPSCRGNNNGQKNMLKKYFLALYTLSLLGLAQPAQASCWHYHHYRYPYTYSYGGPYYSSEEFYAAAIITGTLVIGAGIIGGIAGLYHYAQECTHMRQQEREFFSSFEGKLVHACQQRLEQYNQTYALAIMYAFEHNFHALDTHIRQQCNHDSAAWRLYIEEVTNRLTMLTQDIEQLTHHMLLTRDTYYYAYKKLEALVAKCIDYRQQLQTLLTFCIQNLR